MVSVNGASAIASEPRIHLAVAIADRERRALAGADQQIFLAGEQEGERERAAQPRQRRLDRLDRRSCRCFISSVTRCAITSVSVSVANLAPLLLQLVAQLAEILDDAVVHDRELLGGVRMGVVLGRLAVGRPAGVADADRAGERLAVQPRLEVAQLALGAPARQRAALERGDAGGIVAAIFEALERVDELPRHRLTAENPDNPAHSAPIPLAAIGAHRYALAHGCRKIKMHVRM